ncbi:hypothetical protein [Synechococcus sp. BDU 130192]|uniref:hypothetical protein n=1 Tax=Synechococcus sp. BDU 130192 TaxID=2042059 RepID=UPI000C0858FB|nr:hypothetical protein [Synechococcus sp. BDU 130192]
MIGKKYFKNRLGETYKFSVIPYMYGEGYGLHSIFLLFILKILNNKYSRLLVLYFYREVHQSPLYSWELCVDVCGKSILVLTSKENYGLIPRRINFFIGVSSDNTWNIACKKIKVLNVKSCCSDTEENIDFLYCRPFYVELSQESCSLIQPDYAKVFLSNFHQNDNEIYVEIQEKLIHFQSLKNTKEILAFIEMERLSGAILSEMLIPFKKHETTEDIQYQIQSISKFLSFLRLNSILPFVIEYQSEKEAIQYSITNYPQHPLNRNYSVIDNSFIHRGIPNAFSCIYSNYVDLQAKFNTKQATLNINRLISFMVEINRQRYMDVKLATLIIAYEYFMSKCLLDHGISSDKINNQNIQQKLGEINKVFRFIPKQMTGDTFRGNLRNPLFHEGEIPNLPIEEQISLFENYYDLLIRMVLRLFKYSGEYRSILTNQPSIP